MTNDFSVLCLEADFAEIVASPESSRWTLTLNNQREVSVTMSPSSVSHEQFQACLYWSEYPSSPPSLKFRDPKTGNLNDPRAWPQCPGFRPTSLDSCVNWTAEGHGLHPEWRNSPATRWIPDGNALCRVLHILQDTLDLSFSGRYAG